VREPERAPSILGILDRFDWHRQAACSAEPDPRTFFPDEHDRTKPASGSLLTPLLICSTCPVRRECLEEAFESWDFQHGAWEKPISGASDQTRARGLPDTRSVPSFGCVEAKGIWGGTTEAERRAVRDLSRDVAIDLLYDTNEERLQIRVEAYEEARPGYSRNRRVKRIDAMLEERGRAKL
jgi:hypothetical protein